MSELGRHPESQPPSPVRFLSLGVTSVLCFFFTVLSVQSFAKSPKRKPSGPAKTAIERKAEKSRRPDEADKKGDGDDGKQRSPTKGPWLKEKSSQKIPRGNAEGSKPEASKELDKKKLASKPPMTTAHVSPRPSRALHHRLRWKHACYQNPKPALNADHQRPLRCTARSTTIDGHVLRLHRIASPDRHATVVVIELRLERSDTAWHIPPDRCTAAWSR